MSRTRRIGVLALVLCATGHLAGLSWGDTCPQPITYDGFSLPDNEAAPGEAPQYGDDTGDGLSISELLQTLSDPPSGSCANQIFVPPYNNHEIASDAPYSLCEEGDWPWTPYGYGTWSGEGYVVQNPIFIDHPVFLHGGAQRQATLIPANPSEPLFVVRNAGHVQMAGLRLASPLIPNTDSHRYVPNMVAIRFENTDPVVFEMYDSIFTRSSVEIAGPGTFRIQNAIFGHGGHVRAPIVLDHPEADLMLVSGDIEGSLTPEAPPWPAGYEGPESPMYHIWQKQGRLQVFTTTFEETWGNADIRIESRASNGLCQQSTCPHVIAAVRSEGVKHVDAPYPSSLLYVPPTTEAVDVIMKLGAGAWSPQPSEKGLSHFADYNATGTLWMFGNNGPASVDRLVIGNAPGATVVAFGNRVRRKDDFLAVDVGSGRKIHAGNAYDWKDSTGCDLPGDCCLPLARFINPEIQLSDYSRIPPVPETPVPAPLTRPELSLGFATELGACDNGTPPTCPGMKVVTLPPYSAAGDGIADDTTAIQTALLDALRDGSLMVYFPPGSYKVTGPLQWMHKDQTADLDCGGDQRFDIRVWPGGWIAGAGANATSIVQYDPAESIFETDGMATGTVQGITFQYAPGIGPLEAANVQLEFYIDPNDANGTRIGNNTQKVAFHDCVFDGGKYAVGLGLNSQWQCDTFNFIDCTFKDADYGMAIGGYNTLAILAYGSSFENNEIASGYPIPQEHNPPDFSPFTYGGNWHIINSNITGTTEADLDLVNGGGQGGWYLHGVTTDSEQLLARPAATSGSQHVFFDRTTFSPSVADGEMARMDAGGGLFFLHSQGNANMAEKVLRSNGGMAVLPVFDLYRKSDSPLWKERLSWHDIQRTYVLRGGSRSNDSCRFNSDCNDGLVCTTDRCRLGICEFEPDCDSDSIPCTIEACVATEDEPDGTCVHVEHDLLCDDGTSCTRRAHWNGDAVDKCDATLGCVYNRMSSACCPDCSTDYECDTGPNYPLCLNEPEMDAQGVCSSSTGTVFVPCLDDEDCPEVGDTCVPVHECIDPGTTENFSCIEGDDFVGDSLFVVECSPECLGCRCDNDAQCDDGLLCNGVETCDLTTGQCVMDGPPCAANETCVETCDPPEDHLCEPAYMCLAPCPGTWCDSPPAGPGFGCTSTDLGTNSCITDYGGVAGCPEDQTIHARDCLCIGRPGDSWYCQ